LSGHHRHAHIQSAPVLAFWSFITSSAPLTIRRKPAVGDALSPNISRPQFPASRIVILDGISDGGKSFN
jgi:hypothetical protein